MPVTIFRPLRTMCNLCDICLSNFEQLPAMMASSNWIPSSVWLHAKPSYLFWFPLDFLSPSRSICTYDIFHFSTAPIGGQYLQSQVKQRSHITRGALSSSSTWSFCICIFNLPLMNFQFDNCQNATQEARIRFGARPPTCTELGEWELPQLRRWHAMPIACPCPCPCPDSCSFRFSLSSAKWDRVLNANKISNIQIFQFQLKK